MKLERRVMTIKKHTELARVYLAEAELCLKEPGLFPEISYNPVLIHAAFASACVAFKILKENYPSYFFSEMGVDFLKSVQNGECYDCCYLDEATAVVTTMLSGEGHHVIFRNKLSILHALQAGARWEGYTVSISDMIDELLAVADIIDDEGINEKEVR